MSLSALKMQSLKSNETFAQELHPFFMIIKAGSIFSSLVLPLYRLRQKSRLSNFARVDSPSSLFSLLSFHLRRSPSAPRSAVAAPTHTGARAHTKTPNTRMHTTGTHTRVQTFLSLRCHCFLRTLQSVYISA